MLQKHAFFFSFFAQGNASLEFERDTIAASSRPSLVPEILREQRTDIVKTLLR